VEISEHLVQLQQKAEPDSREYVGEDEMPYADARRLLGRHRIVGVTCAVRASTAPSPQPKPVRRSSGGRP